MGDRLTGVGQDLGASEESVKDKLIRWHDYFNLLCLPVVISLNLSYFLHVTRFSLEGNYLQITNIAENSPSKYAESLNFWVFNTYILVDTLWIIISPDSVPSAPPLIFHHFGTMIGWVSPVFHQRWAFWSSLAALVETNTFFLILKRQQGRNVLIVHVLFYVTWVLLRLLVYPIGLVIFSREYLEYSRQHPRGFLNSGLCMEMLILFLNVLNFNWTIDLVSKQWYKSKAKSKSK